MQKINRIPILMYHIIADMVPPSDVYTVSSYAFLSQMEYLSRSKSRVLTLEEVINSKRGVESENSPAVAITFDDGYISNYTQAFPVLKRFGFTAAFFITTSFVGKSGYLSWQQLREMANAGMTIGSHTVNHSVLTELTDEKIRFEMEESKRILESELDRKVDIFSNPHIFTNKKIQRIALSVGYRVVCISRMGYYPRGSGQNILERINIRNDYTQSDFINIINADSSMLRKIRFQRTAAALIRSIIGMNRYEKLKQFLLPYLHKR